ncbi:DNA polymerase delta catalytic subunit-like [Pollicipes pollicipes]|uniref:DNA polymerase delta catalytic subunit-like n=1 Tax=Pollicipes pollicipes TaxID=41117 RepID=UPI0018854F9C|nr:DNA polymerase delta catalytic subunit-like [Pollicipes pollicipes]
MMDKRKVNGTGSSGPSKRLRGDGEDFPRSTFEEEMALMESMELDEAAGDGPEVQGPESQEVNIKWSRPPLPPLDPSQDAIIFQQMETDYYLGAPLPGMPGAQGGTVPIMRMFGVTADGHSVCCHVHGFAPYFFVSAPDRFTPELCGSFQRSPSNIAPC